MTESLPQDIIIAILDHVEASWQGTQTLLSFGQTCRLYRSLSKTWRPWKNQSLARWPVATKALVETNYLDWYNWYIQQHNQDKATTARLNEIVSAKDPNDRRQLVTYLTSSVSEKLNDYYDLLAYHSANIPTNVIPYLLNRSLLCPSIWDLSNPPDNWLSLRYFSKAILDYQFRLKAMKIWKSIGSSSTTGSFEQTVSAFAAYMGGDPDIISSTLDKLADKFVQETSYDANDALGLATKIVKFLHKQGFVGAHPHAYHNLENHFINIVLQNNIPTLPMTLAAIFVGMCTRLNLDANPINFPRHIFVIISGWIDKKDDEEHKGKGNKDGNFPIFVDPFESSQDDQPVSISRGVDDISILPMSYKIHLLGHVPINLLTPASSFDMTERIIRNILVSLNQVVPHSITGIMARYASLMANYCIRENRNHASLIRMSSLMYKYNLLYLDAEFLDEVEQDIEDFDEQQEHDLMNSNHQVHYRNPDKNHDLVKFHVGSVMFHKKYNYRGVIIGWDPYCIESEAWKEQMNIDRLNNGENQAFYHVLVEDGTSRYVAQENIMLWNQNDQLTWPFIATLMNEHDLGEYFDRPCLSPPSFILGAKLKREYPND